MERINELIVEDARILFRNFAGRETKFNRKGDRNFCLVIEPQDASKLQEIGWAVQTLNSNEDDPLYYIPVKIKYGAISPKVYLITGKKKTLLDEDALEVLDNAEFENIDMVIRPYQWEVNGKTGVKAYLKTMYAVLREDAFAEKYNFEEDDNQFSLDEGTVNF